LNPPVSLSQFQSVFAFQGMFTGFLPSKSGTCEKLQLRSFPWSFFSCYPFPSHAFFRSGSSHARTDGECSSLFSLHADPCSGSLLSIACGPLDPRIFVFFPSPQGRLMGSAPPFNIIPPAVFDYLGFLVELLSRLSIWIASKEEGLPKKIRIPQDSIKEIQGCYVSSKD